MKTGLTMTKDRLKVVLANIAALPAQEVLVGIPDDHGDGEVASHKGMNLRPTTGITNASLGYIHEFGAPEANIPPRAFLMPGIRDGKDAIAKYLTQAGKYALKADKAGTSRALHAAGTVAMNAVRNKINTGPFAALKQSTINARQRRSKGSSYRRKASTAGDVHPLIDTGQLRDAITYVVRKR